MVDPTTDVNARAEERATPTLSVFHSKWATESDIYRYVYLAPDM